MILTAALFTLKRMPRVMMLLLLFISIFILSFLLLGCNSSSATYYSTYLIRYSFNHESTIYPLIKTSFKGRNLTGYEEMQVRAGYMSVCVELGDDINCVSRSSMDSFANLTNVDIYTSNSNSTTTTLDLVNLASEFSNDIVHPYILIATIILSIILLLSLFYIVIPGLPYKHLVNKFNLVLAPVLALLWGLGSIWAHVATDAGQKLVSNASMGIINAHVGRKASSMTWVPFAFLIIDAIGVIGLHLRDLHSIIDAVDEKV